MRRSARRSEDALIAEPYHERGLLRLLATSRYWIGLAVVGSFLGATALLAYGVLETVALVDSVLGLWLTGLEHSTESPPPLAAIAAVDSFLIAVVLYFISVGLYQLSFHPLPLPAWLIVRDLADLEDKLAKVVVLVLGIAFLGQVATWDGQRDLLGYGVATAVVIAALSFHLRRTPEALAKAAPSSESAVP